MNWDSWSAFFQMGGYGRYVWTAYGGVALLIAVEILTLRMRVRNAKRRGRGS